MRLRNAQATSLKIFNKINLIKDIMLGNFKFLNQLRSWLAHVNWVIVAAVALVSLFMLTLVSLYFFPLYPDEIQVRFWLSRLPYDFPQKISGAPACLSTFCQPIPLTMYLPGMVNWLIHGMIGTVPSLRILGMCIALLWLAVLIVYVSYRAERSIIFTPGSNERILLRLYIIGFFIALFSVGVFPVFLISNRSEQLMLPSLAGLIGVFILSRKYESKGKLWQKLSLMLLYFISVSLILYGHAKGLFFIPFFLVVGWQVFGQTYGMFLYVFAMALLGVHLVQDYFAWKYAFQCPEVPQMATTLASFSFDPLSVFYAPRSFLSNAYHSVGCFYRYLLQIGFQRNTDISYLPAIKVGMFAKMANFFIRSNFAIIFFSLLIWLPFQYFRDVVSNKLRVTVNLALLCLLGCGIICAIFNIPKNWYDAGFLYALLLIILTFFIGENFPAVFQRPITRYVFIYVGVISLLSQIVFIHRTLPPFLNGFTGPGVSIAKFKSKNIYRDIVAASQTCGIDIVKGEKLTVDDSTYLFLRKTKYPMAITYIFTNNDDESVLKFFSKVGSDGLIVTYQSMISPYAKVLWKGGVVKRYGDICCISKKDLKSLSSMP